MRRIGAAFQKQGFSGLLWSCANETDEDIKHFIEISPGLRVGIKDVEIFHIYFIKAVISHLFIKNSYVIFSEYKKKPVYLCKLVFL